jgi:hypothetical protein
MRAWLPASPTGNAARALASLQHLSQLLHPMPGCPMGSKSLSHLLHPPFPADTHSFCPLLFPSASSRHPPPTIPLTSPPGPTLIPHPHPHPYRPTRYLWKTAGSEPRSGARRKRGVYEDGGGMEGLEEYGGGGGGGGGGGDDGDAYVRRLRGERGGHGTRRRKRAKQADGSSRDVDMEDAAGSGSEGGGGSSDGGAGRRRRGGRGKAAEGGAAPVEEVDPEKAAAAAAAAAAATAERFGVPDLRELLKQQEAVGAKGAEAARIDELEPAAFEEVVPAADEEGDERQPSGGDGGA